MHFWLWKRVAFIWITVKGPWLPYPFTRLHSAMAMRKDIWSWVNEGAEWEDSFREGLSPFAASFWIEDDLKNPSI